MSDKPRASRIAAQVNRAVAIATAAGLHDAADWIAATLQGSRGGRVRVVVHAGREDREESAAEFLVSAGQTYTVHVRGTTIGLEGGAPPPERAPSARGKCPGLVDPSLTGAEHQFRTPPADSGSELAVCVGCGLTALAAEVPEAQRWEFVPCEHDWRSIAHLGQRAGWEACARCGVRRQTPTTAEG